MMRGARLTEPDGRSTPAGTTLRNCDRNPRHGGHGEASHRQAGHHTKVVEHSVHKPLVLSVRQANTRMAHLVVPSATSDICQNYPELLF